MARGKHSKAISDRSGMEFPYLEMVREWNGFLVHRSEFESNGSATKFKSISGNIKNRNARRNTNSKSCFNWYKTR